MIVQRKGFQNSTLQYIALSLQIISPPLCMISHCTVTILHNIISSIIYLHLKKCSMKTRILEYLVGSHISCLYSQLSCIIVGEINESHAEDNSMTCLAESCQKLNQDWNQNYLTSNLIGCTRVHAVPADMVPFPFGQHISPCTVQS